MTAAANLYTRYPFVAHSLTGGLLWFVGDVLSQKIAPLPSTSSSSNSSSTSSSNSSNSNSNSSSNSPVDWRRVGIMSSFGLAAGPAYALWYRFLEKAVVRYYSKPTLSTPTAAASTSTSTKWKIAITKVIADFSIFDIPYLSVFFLSTNMASGYSFEDSFKRLRRDLLPTFGVEVATWTPIQLLNFRFVKVPYQPIVVNGVNVGWNAYLSYVKHQ